MDTINIKIIIILYYYYPILPLKVEHKDSLYPACQEENEIGSCQGLFLADVQPAFCYRSSLI